MNITTIQKTKTTSFRIASDLLDRVQLSARANGRTTRSEIERVLRERFHEKPKAAK